MWHRISWRRRFTLSLSAYVIVRDAEYRTLLLRRASTGWKDGFHSLPAGAHDGHEPLAVAATRERREETCLVARPDDLRLVHLLPCTPSEGNGEWLGAIFLADAWSGTPTLAEPDKHDHIGWHARKPCRRSRSTTRAKATNSDCEARPTPITDGLETRLPHHASCLRPATDHAPTRNHFSSRTPSSRSLYMRGTIARSW